MAKKLLFPAILLLFSGIVFAQPSFQKTYDIGGDDYSNALHIINGNYYICGSTTKVGAGGFDATMMGFDSTGAVLWQKQYGGSSTEFGTQFIQDATGLAMIGRSNSTSSNHSQDIALFKTDMNGDLQWGKGYHSDSVEVGSFVSLTPDGGYILTGQTQLGNGGNDLVLVKITSTGALQWARTYGSTGNEIGSFVTPSGDGGYLALGYSGFGGAGLNDVYLVKTDSAGTLQGQILLGGTGDDAGKFFAPAGNSSFVLVGNAHPNISAGNKIFIANFNANTLQLNWCRVYGGSGDDQVSSITPAGNGFIVTGNTHSFGNGNQGLIFQIDSAGNVGFAATIGSTGDDYINGVETTSDGEVALTGYSNSFGGVQDDIYLAKSHNGLCNNLTQVSIVDSAWLPTITGPIIVTHTSNAANFTVDSLGLTQNSYSPTVTDICALASPLSASAGNNKTVCQGLSTTIGGNPTASGGTGPYHYAWSPAAGLNDSTLANPTASPSSGTVTYTVVVTDSNNTTASASVSVNVNPLPTVTLSGNPDTLCVNGAAVTLSGGSPAGGVFSGNGVSNGSFSPSTAGTGTTTITYTYTDNTTTCVNSATENIVVKVCTGIEEMESRSISVVPNPSNGNFQINLGDENFVNSEIRIYDLSGKVVYTSLVNADRKMNISLGDVAKGAYIIQIRNPHTSLYHKLVIE